MNQFIIQKAVYEKLVNDLNWPVYDKVPQGSSYPYINIGEDTSVQWDTDTSVGLRSTLTLHAWSRQAGRKEVKDMMDAIYNSLHRALLVLDSYNMVTCECVFQETFLDADGETRHGVIRFVIIWEGEV